MTTFGVLAQKQHSIFNLGIHGLYAPDLSTLLVSRTALGTAIAGMSTASLTYSTAEGSRSEFIDYSLAYWAMAFEGRLSQDDVTAPGTYTRIDLAALATPIQAGTNPATED